MTFGLHHNYNDDRNTAVVGIVVINGVRVVVAVAISYSSSSFVDCRFIFQIAASVPVHWQCLVFDHLMNKNHLQRFDSSGHSTIQHKWTDQFISDKDINSFYIFIEYKLQQKRKNKRSKKQPFHFE